MSHIVTCQLGGKDFVIETGRMAKQADGAVTVRYGNSMVLATVVISRNPKEGADFVPLFCEYQEKTYAAGKIPGGFFKREGRPTEKGTLSSRLIDRPIRPLFPKDFRNEIQVIASVLSADGENDTDVLAMVGAFAALAISSYAMPELIGAVRVGFVDSKYVVNPTFDQVEESTLNLILAASKENILMVEAGAKIVSEEELLGAIAFGHKEIQQIIKIQEDLATQASKPKKEFPAGKVNAEVISKVKASAAEEMQRINQEITEKHERDEAIHNLEDKLIADLVTEDGSVTKADVKGAVEKLETAEVRRMILEKKRRSDGRDYKTIRPITCEIGLLPRTHGSALFTRGQTQSLSTTTLGGSSDVQRIDALEGEFSKSFMLHYNFPPFSVGEVRPMRGPGRREIGHGALAERALRPVMPEEQDFPYTIRIVSDILESNGSSSMATVCAGTLSLMEAGVPIKAPVSGIAMGLVKEGDQYAVLTDIIGLEDHLGDMDFKVTGTAEGVTALQMDIKIQGLTPQILKEALEQAREARLEILKKMTEAIAEPKKDISQFAPRIVTLKIKVEKIGGLIGPGGKNIRKIISETGCEVNVEDDGTVQICSNDPENTKKATEWIEGIVAEPEIGKVYSAKIVRFMKFGAFAEFMPGKDGLIHVSELSSGYVDRPEEIVKMDQEVQVKVIEVDSQGRVNLSRKQAMSPEEFEKEKALGGDKKRPQGGTDRGPRPSSRGPRGNSGRSGPGRHDREGNQGPQQNRDGGGSSDHRRSSFRDRSEGRRSRRY